MWNITPSKQDNKHLSICLKKQRINDKREKQKNLKESKEYLKTLKQIGIRYITA